MRESPRRSKELVAHGIDLSFISLRFMRDTAFAFKAADRRAHSFAVYQATRSPETLAAVIESLPGETVTVRHVREFLRARRDPAPTKDAAPAPDTTTDFPALMAPLVAALKMHTRAFRAAKVMEMMKVLGVGLADLGAGARTCQLEAARHMRAATVEERAVA